MSKGEISLERLASFPLLTYSFGYTGRSNIENAFKKPGLNPDIILAAADSDVIKTCSSWLTDELKIQEIPTFLLFSIPFSSASVTDSYG